MSFSSAPREGGVAPGSGGRHRELAPTGGRGTPPVRVRLGTPPGRWAVAAAVLGSGVVFIESTVVSVALPAMGRDLGLGVAGLQWIVNGYLVTLGALLLFGGALGDAFGQRRVFEAGLVAFAGGSLLCALAPGLPTLIGARLLQGAAGALLVPTSLAFLDGSFVREHRSEAIGVWAAWSGASTAVGPLLGGALVDVASWRWVFAGIVPFALAPLWISRTRLPRPSPAAGGRIDYLGAVLVSAGLAGIVWALVEGPARGATPLVLAVGAAGLGLLAAFMWIEARHAAPLLPLGMFRSRQFSGANATTLLVYAAIGGVFFFLMVQLQAVVGYGALAAGASLLPLNAALLALSPAAARWGERRGPRVPTALGALVVAVGLVLFTRVAPGSTYLAHVFPATLVFGIGLGLLVAPLTASVLAVAEEERKWVASAVNNATARVAGLLAVALLPLAVGIGGLDTFSGPAFSAGYRAAMWICAALCAVGAAVAWFTVREGAPAVPGPHPSPTHGCTGVDRVGLTPPEPAPGPGA